MIEYALIAGLIAIVAITAMTTLGSKVNEKFGKIGTELNKT